MSMQLLPSYFVRRRVSRTSCTATARTCARRQPGDLLAAVRRILFFVLERRSTPFARRPVPQPFLHVHPWRSDSTNFSPSSGGVDAYNSGLACVLYSFATHLACALGFLSCSLSVSAHPVLMGALPVTSCGDECTPLLDVLPWRTFPDQVSRLCCHPNAILPTS